MKKSTRVSWLGYSLMAASSLITLGIFIWIQIPLILALLLSGLSIRVFFVALNNPRDGSLGAAITSGIILAWLVLFYFIPWDIARSFKLTLVGLSAMYFLGSLLVYLSTGKQSQKA
ncbi:hypothetical protein JP09_009290 [Dehalogenimonas etheniformans]|uniref:Uncharacterized protein n=1 Tax=Dehalogenimonas etheniformans TaxID=1536648 RepID=A0A2P5P5E2_9CHLR|nr:hypothetical protein JP09_009290 [Dehalogenimonas etheniformans]